MEFFPGAGLSRMWSVTLGISGSIAGLRRGRMPLHASAIHTAKGCVAIAGQSGVGKSTLAGGLVNRNFPLFADDLCLLSLGDRGVRVGRGLTEIRLCEDAAGALGWRPDGPAEGASPVKTLHSRPGDCPDSAVLRRIYALDFEDDPNLAGIRRIEGVEAMRALLDCLRLRLPLLRIGDFQAHFEQLAHIAREVEIFPFRQTARPDAVPALDGPADRSFQRLRKPANSGPATA